MIRDEIQFIRNQCFIIRSSVTGFSLVAPDSRCGKKRAQNSISLCKLLENACYTFAGGFLSYILVLPRNPRNIFLFLYIKPQRGNAKLIFIFPGISKDQKFLVTLRKVKFLGYFGSTVRV